MFLGVMTEGAEPDVQELRGPDSNPTPADFHVLSPWVLERQK